jgi:hypothetical protein
MAAAPVVTGASENLAGDHVPVPGQLADVAKFPTLDKPEAAQVVGDQEAHRHQQSDAGNHQVAHPQKKILPAHP